MKFFGMREPRLNSPLIEVETIDERIVDLYNESNLVSVTRRGDELVFAFEAADGYGSLDAVLRFVEVRDLQVEQPEDWHPLESYQIEDLMIRKEGPWRRIVFKAGGLEYEFNAAELRVEVEPAAS